MTSGVPDDTEQIFCSECKWFKPKKEILAGEYGTTLPPKCKKVLTKEVSFDKIHISYGDPETLNGTNRCKMFQAKSWFQKIFS